YTPSKYRLKLDGAEYDRQAFMVSVANSPQYGNNAFIAPRASVNDGTLHVCIVKNSPLYIRPTMVFHLFNRSVNQSEYVKIIPDKDIFIERDDNGPVHVDGERLNIEGNLTVKVKPLCLKIIC